jgi:succinate dehydrogenase flavin-adding protein (antitoxin of CptAB toxin-antitoxin module)
MTPTLDPAGMRRLRWRCRRGLLENDLVLERFLDRHGAALGPAELAALARLLELPDPDLWDIVSGRAQCAEPELAGLVERLRAC